MILVRIDPVRRQLRRVENATSSWSERLGLLVTLESDSGAWGQGEVSPLPGYSPDSLEACRQALATVDAKALADVAGETDVERLLARAAGLLPASVPAARFGLETALLDLAGKSRKVPAWRLFGRHSAPELALAAMIGSAGDPELLASAERALARGITTLKVKLGVGEFRHELSALRALRARLPPEAALRLDANQSLSATRLGELGELEPQFVEEPVPPAALGELSASFMPLALDESLQARSDAELAQLLELPNLRAVVLKPMALGGILRCLEIAAAARERRIDVIVSHMFEGPLAHTAAAVLAFEIGTRGVAMGLDRHAGLDAWDCSSPPAVASGRLAGWSGFGLGLTDLGARP